MRCWRRRGHHHLRGLPPSGGRGGAASDAEVAKAVGFAFRELKLVVEPGGAVALAALLNGRLDAVGKTVVIVLSGGNVDPDTFSTCIRA